MPASRSSRLSRRGLLAALAGSALGVRAQAQDTQADQPQDAPQRPPQDAHRLQMGVEATLQASGLAGRLRQALARDTGLVIDWNGGPSGLVLPRLEAGALDAALTQLPGAELALERDNLIHDRQPVALNELVLVGPAPRRGTRRHRAGGDPAGVAGLGDAALALGRVAATGARREARFVSYGEPSGAQALEQGLWVEVGPHVQGDWHLKAGPGPTAVLDMARQTQSYALVERGVWMAHGGGSGLALMVAGDPRLVTTYHVMLAFRAHHPAARLVVGWLTGANGRAVVSRFGRGYRVPPA